jgi:hypothetical protein
MHVLHLDLFTLELNQFLEFFNFLNLLSLGSLHFFQLTFNSNFFTPFVFLKLSHNNVAITLEIISVKELALVLYDQGTALLELSQGTLGLNLTIGIAHYCN